jgi:hypothetical protein
MRPKLIPARKGKEITSYLYLRGLGTIFCVINHFEALPSNVYMSRETYKDSK